MIRRPAHPRPAIRSRVYRICFLILILSIITTSISHAEGMELDYFYESGCLKCNKASPVIDSLAGEYAGINYSKHEIGSSFSLARQYGVTTVPSVVINRTVLIEYGDYNGDPEILRELLIEGIENAPSISDVVEQGNSSRTYSESWVTGDSTPAVVLIAGLLAGFNPCLLAVMAFLASAVLSSNGSRKDMLVIVIGFCAGIFITYMVAGLGILNAISSMPGIRDIITSLMVGIVAILGLWHIYDAYHMKLHSRSSLKTPRSLIDFMRNADGKNILFVSLAGGALFSLIKAPCVGAVYLTILEMLMSGNDPLQGAIYLGLYNLGVVLPILILGTLLAFGLDPAKVDAFREKRRVEIRFITGIFLIMLAILLNLNVI